jgi:hypothetical protein
MPLPHLFRSRKQSLVRKNTGYCEKAVHGALLRADWRVTGTICGSAGVAESTIDMTGETVPAPKVFLSHASDDKDRFVLEFANRLMANGVDVWLDAWEINPGDNPVKKIFEEGLKECQAVILVMSAVSVQKPWVRAELDHAFVKRVEGRARLIPLRLDDCAMPECLLTTRWESITDCRRYDAVFDRVLNAIFDHHPKPPVGSPPPYAAAPSIPIGGLEHIDSLVFERACWIAIKQDQSLVDEGEWQKAIEDLSLTGERLVSAQEMLDEEGYIKLHQTIGPPDSLHSFSISLRGFQEFAKACLPGFNELVSKVAASLARGDGKPFPSGNSLAREFGEPLRVIEHILELLENNGLIEISRQLGGDYMTVWRVSAKLKRAASQGF